MGWLPLMLVAVAIVVTYARVPPHELYHVSGSGLDAGLGRALVFLNWPVAVATLPLIALAADRLREQRLAVAAAVVAAVLCAFVAWPGVVDQADLDPKWMNALPALGVVLGLGLAAAAGLFRTRARADALLVVVLVLLLVLTLPYIAADLGFFLDDVPALGSLFITGKVVVGEPAVHHGHHHGMDGALLVLAALATIPALKDCRSRRLGIAVAAYLGIELVYGLTVLVNDDWLEQIVKRGWTSVEVPNVIHPAVNFGWLWILVAGGALAAWICRRERLV